MYKLQRAVIKGQMMIRVKNHLSIDKAFLTLTERESKKSPQLRNQDFGERNHSFS